MTIDIDRLQRLRGKPPIGKSPMGGGSSVEQGEQAENEGSPTANVASDELKSIQQRLAKLRCGGLRPARRSFVRVSDWAQRLGGEEVAPGVARIVTRKQVEPLATTAQAFWDIDDPSRLMLMDTETTGLAGGTGTSIFLLSAGQVRGDELVCTQWLLASPASEPRWVEQVVDQVVTHTPHWVTFNGKSFDLPLLETRLTLAGRRMTDALHRGGHIDLVHPLRRAFRHCWPDCRLTTAEARLLGQPRTNDLPGSEAPEAWQRFVRTGDDSMLRKIIQHNAVDTFSLWQLLQRLANVYADPQKHGAHVGDVAAVQSDQTARDMLERADPTQLDPRSLHQLARLQRRAGHWHKAAKLWQQLATQSNDKRGCDEARRCLAKYAEHQLGDLPQALSWTRQLLQSEPNNPDLHHRHQRLLRKLGDQGDIT